MEISDENKIRDYREFSLLVKHDTYINQGLC